MDAKVSTPAAPLSSIADLASERIGADSDHEEEIDSQPDGLAFGGKKMSSSSFAAKPAGGSFGSWGSATSGFNNGSSFGKSSFGQSSIGNTKFGQNSFGTSSIGSAMPGYGGYAQSSFGKPSSGFGFGKPSSGFSFGKPSSGFSFGTQPNSSGDLAVKQQLQQQRQQKAKEEQNGSAAAAAVPSELVGLGDNLGSFGNAGKTDRKTCHELVFVPLLLRNSALRGDVELRDVVDGTGTVKVHASRAISTHVAGLKLPRADMVVPRRVSSLLLGG